MVVWAAWREMNNAHFTSIDQHFYFSACGAGDWERKCKIHLKEADKDEYLRYSLQKVIMKL